MKAPRVREKPRSGARFRRKGKSPTVEDFGASLAPAAGKTFEAVRAFLTRQTGVVEETFYYGPRSGWALRYVRDGRPLCTLMILGDRPLGIVALDSAAAAAMDWSSLSPIGQKARRLAHDRADRLWLDVSLEGPGAGDFKALVRAKLKRGPKKPGARAPRSSKDR